VSEPTSFRYSNALPRGFRASVEDALSVRPTGLLYGRTAERARAAGFARPLAGGPIAFAACELFLAASEGVEIAAADLGDALEWAGREGGAVAAATFAALERLSAPRPAFAGVTLDRPILMGIVNVTPDSFSDGGRFADADAAIRHGRALLDAGCGIVDVGGESTRPGAAPTDEAEELRRVLPVVRGLAGRGAAVSIDTRRAGVMRAAIDCGATIVNDVSALAGDPGSLAAVAASGASAILMHMLGAPPTMQRRPVYGHAPYEVLAFLRSRVRACQQAGIPLSRLAIDPGIGFGKTPSHNAQLLAEGALLHDLGCAVVAGASRKSFIARLSRGEDADARLPGTLAALAAAAAQGIQIHRVHDAAEARQALAILNAVMAH
jgi:dihydropteroate synthase